MKTIRSWKVGSALPRVATGLVGLLLVVPAARALGKECGVGNVSVCHRPPGNLSNFRVLCIDEHGVAAHLGHGDNVVAPEACGDGVDNDCDGLLDAADDACASIPPGSGGSGRECAPGTPVAQCLEGTYWLHQSGVFGGPGLAHDAIVIEGGRIRTLSGCPAVQATMRRTNDAYLIRATWPSCDGGPTVRRRRVKIQGTIDLGSRGTFIGRFSSPGGFTSIVATRTYGDAIRIGTYNAKFLTSSFPVDYDKNPSDAAEQISKRIIASGYDFIALQEIWDEDAKSDHGQDQGFVEMLRDTYPYYVQYADGDQLNPHEDSGLMFFSRFPFEDLPHDTYQIDWGDCKASDPDHNGHDDCDKVAFLEYDSCDDDDCLAEKGVGFVRLRNPRTDRFYNVAFTHMQAPYYDDDPDDMLSTYDTRAEQMGEIQTLLEGTLDDAHFDNDEVYLLGDLNIDGNYANLDLGEPDAGDPQSWMFVHNKREWARQFDTPGAFFTDTLMDAWANDTSPDDLGLSAPRNYEPYFDPSEGRLDYIARNAKSQLCTQHLTLSHNLRSQPPYVESGLGEPGTEAGSLELSDHIGVTADINVDAPFCSARAPREVVLGPGQTRSLLGEIRHAGSMQWFRFSEPGTYGFGTDDDHVKIHVYERTDLSMPMANYKGLTREVEVRTIPHLAEMFDVPAAPFYVRVFVPEDPEWTGNYHLIAKRYDCSSQEDACFLTPQQRQSHVFPAGTVVGTDDTMWFELHTDSTGWKRPNYPPVDTGVAQHLDFEVDRLEPGADALVMRVLADDGTTVLLQDGVYEPDSAEPTFATDPKDLLIASFEEAGPKTRFITVARDDENEEATFRVQWRTNLTVLHGSQVGVPNAVALDFSVADHGDSFGDEEYYFWLLADDSTVVDEHYLGEFSEPSNFSMESLFTSVRYVDSVRVIWVEVDNAYDGGYNSIDDDDVIKATIGALDAVAPCKTGQTRTMVDDGGEGSYTFRYNRCHGLPIP